ncbi:MAG TPA: glycine--tRNA ligase subunit beta [Vitreimonas sp.]|uniref:glycine--tRNA ligase subunit beta n=1 Tax=Vitreimonas sp. TaxID=3069702 RepID=UPI002D500B27|nr:glycine--tRNA ligase subunit beta [Vitreimonas sp.]HYD89021.1 glycine--tRNA ligase subunit beta [Vitreimonas sp.]
MPQLLLEFFSEEIPARMQKRAEEDLARALAEKLRVHGLEAKAIKTFSSPRRIGAVIDDLPAKAADVNEERKGPRVGAPDQAIQGFLKGAGLTSIDQAQIVEDKKGAFYVARTERAGRETGAIVQEIVPEIVRAFPWPKSMRSGTSDLTWVRPLQNILCLFGGKHVAIGIENVPSQNLTWGHRFHAPAPIEPKNAADHAARLRAAKVEIDREARKARILEDAKNVCAARGLELVDDIGLLEEVAGLVEWPVVLLGDMDPAFLDLPGEVIRLSMRTHQKYFAVRDPKSGKLAPHFVTVANVEAKDGGKAIAAGNARVLSARLNDARFFWDTDKKTTLFTEERREKLKKIVFHQKLGSVWDKVERVKALAGELCAVTGADRALVERAAELCKMDLVTETVGEFPELQGQVGRQLYLLEVGQEPSPPSRGRGQGEGGRADAPAPERLNAPHLPASSPQGGGGDQSIAAAIEDHYRPLGPNDRVPSDPVAVTLALADKLDTLVGFWAIDEKPTGSSDPFALRRAALGFARLVIDRDVRMSVRSALGSSHSEFLERFSKLTVLRFRSASGSFRSYNDLTLLMKEPAESDAFFYLNLNVLAGRAETFDPGPMLTDQFAEKAHARFLPIEEMESSLLAFLADRLKVQLRDQGKRHDLVDAVFALGDDDLVRIVARVEALDAFLKTEDGANLLAGYKRAANILAAEEKKGKWSADEAQGQVDAKLLAEPAEKALHEALEKALPAARAAVDKEEFAAAMKALSGLRAPVDAFFDKVLVNAPEEQVRRNRLLLLSRFREALSAVADFSKVEG